MRVRPSFARPPVCLATFLSVCAWTAAPASGPPTAVYGYEQLCVLRADPRVIPSYVPPRAPRREPGTNLAANAAANIIVNYNGFTPQAQAAFQFAVNIWSAQLSSGVPITVDAFFQPLDPGVLGAAGATTISANFAGAVPGTWYPAATANRLSGFDRVPSLPDIEAQFGSGFTWYFGTDGLAPAGTYDFVSVVLHELGHGLGFFGSGTEGGGTGVWGYLANPGNILPTIYDRFVINGSGQSIIDTGLFPNPSAALAGQLTGNNLYFSGPFERAANGNAAARLYAPSPFDPGSSYSHLNESTYLPGNPNSLMTPFLSSSEAVHDPGPITRGMFQDMGWQINSTPPPPTCTYVVGGTPLSFAAAGGTGTLSIGTTPTCSWSVQNFVSWITITSSTSGTGSGTVNFTVAANPSSAARAATLVVAGQPVIVNQAGVACAFSAATNLVTFSANGGSRTVAITANASDCAFTSSSSAPWVSVAGSHTGSSTVTVTAQPSAAATRAATVTIAGATIGVRQNGHATPTFDINNDGAADLLAYNPTTGSRFFAFGNPGTPGFTAGATSAYSTGWSIYPGDFNGDGRGDLFFYNVTTGRAFKGLSNGTEDLTYTEQIWSPDWQITVADLNGDGLDDVFTYNPVNGRWFRCISQPDGSFTFPNFGTWSPNWSIYTGDFNADGRDDLFLYNATSDANRGRTYRVLSNADHSLTFIAGEFPWANNWTITPGDYDGDGQTDLFLYGPTGQWYRVFFSATSARFEGGAWSAGWTLSRGDFNGDGRTDLFVYNATTGRWYVVISQANGSLAYYGDIVWSAGWQVHVTDVNVDGVSDLVLYNVTDGRWFQAVTQSPGVFAFANGTWAAGMQIKAARPQVK